MLLVIVVILLYLTDSRMLMGVNIWLKPLKFCVSIAIFLFTSSYIVAVLPYTSFKIRMVEILLIGTMLLEIGCILYQAARGQQSHFNISSKSNALIFSAMGVAISMTYLTYAWILIDFFRLETSLSSPMYWAIVLGIGIFLIGGISGFIMASSLRHNVGAADGGVGLPFTNWSTVVGDLRVSHFISLHGLQFLPLLVLLLIRLNINVSPQLTIVVSVGILYAVFAILTLIQALNGKPFIRIDEL